MPYTSEVGFPHHFSSGVNVSISYYLVLAEQRQTITFMVVFILVPSNSQGFYLGTIIYTKEREMMLDDIGHKLRTYVLCNK